ncbi:unnamed protein product [Paramecium primaurelia]|uniref:Peptidase M14 domain-containing protein n=1 Tax=Paramecium primaurelia TaxID=5886 RepID=A0A8S1MTB3_PARPR|nr:unnamed protein product [Paramecium primaurelia]
MLPESLPILKELSLEMDMLNGWMPNIQYPIRLKFEMNDDMLWSVQRDQLVYVGPRYVDSMEMCQKYLNNYQPTKNQTDMMEAIQKKQRQLRLFINRPQAQKHFIQFDSDFESGNLDFAFQVRPNEYNCYMRCDSNSRSSHSWYHFSLVSERTQIIKLNICNFSKHRSLYQRGMRPYIGINGIWKQGGDNIIFDQKNQRQSRLSFDLTLVKEQKIYVAYGVPYTYSQMMQFIQPLGYSIFTRTPAGIDIPILQFGEAKKRTIIVTARVHPGESNSSHLMEGFLKYLISPDGEYLLQNSQVIAIPMLNPDGVIAGNFRTCLQGMDLNRQFSNPDQNTTPQIYQIKRMIEKLKNPPFVYIDMHGHSLKKNLFIYGPEYPIFSLNYLKCRVLAKLMSEATEVFRYWSGIWRVQPNKRNTARAILNQEFKIVNCFTIECSNGLYYLGSQQITKEFGILDFQQLGQELGKQVQNLLEKEIKYIEYQKDRLKNRKKKRINPYTSLLQQIQKDEEEHQIQDEDELLQSESSEEEVKKKKIFVRKFPQPRQSQLRQEIECRKSFVSDRKPRSQDKSLDKSQISQRPFSPYTPFKRSVSSSRYVNCPTKQQQLKQRLSNYGFN